MNVKHVLNGKKSAHVDTIRADASVCEAAARLSERNIGSMLVLSKDEKIVGILSERDCLHATARACAEIDRLSVGEIMTRDVIICQPDDDLETIENSMTQNRVRHLPVVDGENLVGLISIGDIVKSRTREVEVENRYLRDFIMGKYPG
jgi:CBS domain-containing protein